MVSPSDPTVETSAGSLEVLWQGAVEALQALMPSALPMAARMGLGSVPEEGERAKLLQAAREAIKIFAGCSSPGPGGYRFECWGGSGAELATLKGRVEFP